MSVADTAELTQVSYSRYFAKQGVALVIFAQNRESAISAPHFPAFLHRKGFFRFFSGIVCAREHFATGTDPAPFADEAPVAEEIGLDVEVIEPRLVLFGVDETEGDGGHGLSLPIVVGLTA